MILSFFLGKMLLGWNFKTCHGSQGSRAPVTPSEMPVPTFVSGALKIFGPIGTPRFLENLFVILFIPTGSWVILRFNTLKGSPMKKIRLFGNNPTDRQRRYSDASVVKDLPDFAEAFSNYGTRGFWGCGVLAWIEWWETCREMECNWRIPSKLMVLLKIQKSIYPPEVYIYKAPTKNSGFFTTCSFSPVSRRISAPSSLMSQGVNCFLLWGNEQIKRSTVGFSARIVFGISWVQRWIRLQHFCGEATNIANVLFDTLLHLCHQNYITAYDQTCLSRKKYRDSLGCIPEI